MQFFSNVKKNWTAPDDYSPAFTIFPLHTHTSMLIMFIANLDNREPARDV